MSGAIPPLDFTISYHGVHKNSFHFTLVALCKTSNAYFVSLNFVMENILSLSLSLSLSKRPSEGNIATKLGRQQN